MAEDLSVTFSFLMIRFWSKGLLWQAFADPSLELLSLSNHGLDVIGTPFEVTRSVENHVYELDGDRHGSALQISWTTGYHITD